MVHTRHSFLKEAKEDFSTHNGHCELNENERDKEIPTKPKADNDGNEKHVELNSKDNAEDDEPIEEPKKDEKPTRKKRRALPESIFDSLTTYHNTYQRRSLRKMCKEENKRFREYETSSRKNRMSFNLLGSSLIRRSDRQRKKVFDTFNESKIQREIERKNKEMLEEASMYDSIKRRREEQSDTQDDDEEDSEEESDEEEGGEEGEEGGGESGEPHHAYSLRKVKRKTKFYEAQIPTSNRRRREVTFTMESPMRKSRRQRIPQHSSSPHHRRYKRQKRSSSTSSSDDEEAFERRKAKSMSQARARCLPMNFRANDIVDVLKNRERAREAGLAGASLADVEPMTVDCKTSFEDVGGLDHHIRALKEMVVFPLIYPEVFQKFGISPPRGVLFYGPPGTGKTLVARALANECSQKGQKVAFFMRKGADCLSKWVGESERQLRLLFDQAYTMRPSIIFFDEIDGIAPVRSTRQDQIHSSIVSTLLALMDGLDARGEIVVIGATNRLDSIDPALRRPGRFDREFLFGLPNRKARQKILELHTSCWQPKLSKGFTMELADKCIGYCGADIKALCTEAALFALRRRYPQIYKSSKKYVLDTNEIKIAAVDFKNALKSITPASNRSIVSPGAFLPDALKPMLGDYVDRVLDIVLKVFPAGKKITDYDKQEKINLSDVDDEMSIYEKARSRSRQPSTTEEFKIGENVVEKCLTHRPRLLVYGVSDNGQTTYVAPSLLHAMEHLTAHVVDLPVLFGSSTRTPEEAVSQVFREAKRTSPSIIYLPHIVAWWGSVTETTRATFITLLQDIKPSVPVLFLATSEFPLERIPEQVQDLFSSTHNELFEVKQPSSSQRHEYFKKLFLDHALRTPTQRKNTGNVVEVLQEAPPPKPRELSQEEVKKLIESEEKTLRELRLFLRNVTWKLLADRKFKEFSKPVDSEEVDDYLQVIKQPMDLSTIMTRINSHHYHTCAHFLEDIDLITNNCLEYNPDKDQIDRLLRNRACELRDIAYALVENDLDPEFDKLCMEVDERRKQRGDNNENAPSFLKVLPTHLKNTQQHQQNEATTTNYHTSSTPRPISNIPDPVGTRYSRRVRGINDGIIYDTSALELVESSRRRNAKLQQTKSQRSDDINSQSDDASAKSNDVTSMTDDATYTVQTNMENGCLDTSSNDMNSTVVGVGANNKEVEEDTTYNSNAPGIDKERDIATSTNNSVDTTIDKVKRSLEFPGTESPNKEFSETEEAERLLSILVEKTEDACVQELERVFSRFCRLISEQKKEKDRISVLKEMEVIINALDLTQ